MRLEIGICFCISVAVGLSSALPFPQNSGEGLSENSYLPRGNPVQSLQGQGFQSGPQQQQTNIDSQNTRFSGMQEILNLTPPLPLPVANEQVRAVVSAAPKEGQLQDSYSNLRLPSTSSAVKIGSALVNPHEYGETVPGEFSSLNTYAAYHNYQAN